MPAIPNYSQKVTKLPEKLAASSYPACTVRNQNLGKKSFGYLRCNSKELKSLELCGFYFCKSGSSIKFLQKRSCFFKLPQTKCKSITIFL